MCPRCNSSLVFVVIKDCKEVRECANCAHVERDRDGSEDKTVAPKLRRKVK